MSENFQNLPHGLEVLILKASVDPEFKILLLDRRAEAAKEIGLDLSPVEAAMLGAIPSEQLELIIAQTEVPQESRRAFLGTAAAAMIAALGLSLEGCSSFGHRPLSFEFGHRPIERYPSQQLEGIRPDRPEDFPQDVHFEYDKFDIRPDQFEILDRNLKFFKANSDLKIAIIGHTDERGTIEYNLALGERRAIAVRDYLIRNGVATERLFVSSEGKEHPLDLGHNEEAWANNRRVHFMRRY